MGSACVHHFGLALQLPSNLACLLAAILSVVWCDCGKWHSTVAQVLDFVGHAAREDVVVVLGVEGELCKCM